MAKKLYEESSVKAIANAIRRKNGSTDTYKTEIWQRRLMLFPAEVRRQTLI